VTRFDPGSGTVTKVEVGKGPVGVTYGAGSVWIANSFDGTISRVDPRTNSVRLVEVGGAPTALAISGNQIWTTVLAGPASHMGGVIRFEENALFQSLGKSLDPAQFAGFSQWQMLSLTNDGLVTYRRVGGLAGSSVVPDLATSLPAPTDNGRTYTFRLRSGIRYSTGALVRPEDFRHEFERIFRLNNAYAEGFYTGIVGARACAQKPKECSFARGIVPNDAADTVTFHLTVPDPDFFYKLAFPWADAIPAKTPYGDLGRSVPPATGPYMTKSISPSRVPGPPGHGPVAFHTWTLVRNPHFREWSPEALPQGYPDQIELTDDGSPQRSLTDVVDGSVDVLLLVPPNRLADFAVHHTQQLHSESGGGIFAPVMNTRIPPFNDVRVRQALNYALDRGRMVGFAGGPLAAQPTCQILPPTISGYDPYCPYTLRPGPSGTWSAPDPARAKKLVGESGTEGMRVTVLVPPADETNPTIAIGSYLVSLLKGLGYKASLRVTDKLYHTISDSRSHFQLAWFNWYQDYPAPSNFIAALLACHAFVPHSQTNMNDSEFCDSRVDARVRRAQALQATAPGAASEAWAAIDRQITERAPWLPLYNPRLDIATSARVGNYQFHPFFALLLDQLWVR
jgi:peptide/nickel transport system substrate-binding protein